MSNLGYIYHYTKERFRYLKKSSILLHVTRHWSCKCRCKDGDCLRELQFVSIQRANVA